jgi:hypothetical protein
VAVRLPQHRHCAPRPAEKAGLWCLGVFLNENLLSKIELPQNRSSKKTLWFNQKQKINKKKVKVSFSFKKRKFMPCGFSKKSPPFIFVRINI